jgi:hypothetical protein
LLHDGFAERTFSARTGRPAGDADPGAPASARRHPLRRLARAMVSTDSYGSVLLLILFTYGFSVTVTATWAASL